MNIFVAWERAETAQSRRPPTAGGPTDEAAAGEDTGQMVTGTSLAGVGSGCSQLRIILVAQSERLGNGDPARFSRRAPGQQKEKKKRTNPGQPSVRQQQLELAGVGSGKEQALHLVPFAAIRTASWQPFGLLQCRTKPLSENLATDGSGGFGLDFYENAP